MRFQNQIKGDETGDHGRPDNRSICLSERMIYTVMQKKVEFN